MKKVLPCLLLSLAVPALAGDSPAPAAEAAEPAPAEAAPSLAADCAAIVLGNAGDARWIVAEGPLVRALRDAAAAAGGKAVVLPLVGGDDETLDAAEAAAADIPSEKVRRALGFGTVSFLRAWLAEDPEAVASSVFLAAAPALADATGFVALPSGLGYRLVATNAVPDRLAAAAEACAAARDALGEALSTSADPKAAYSPAVGPYRALAGQAGNRLGCLLFRAGQTNEALQAFLSADSVYPPGGSAVLNAASLVRRGMHPEAAAGIANRLEALRHGERWNLYAEGGPVLFPEDFFEGSWYWTASGLVPFESGSGDRLKAALDAIPEADRPRAAARFQQAARLVAASVAPIRFPAADAPAADALAAASGLFYRGERLRADRFLRKAAFDDPADSLRAALVRAGLLATGGNAAKAAEILEAGLEGASADPLPGGTVSPRELLLRGLAEAAAETLDLQALRPRLLALVGEKGAFAGWAAKDSAAIGSLRLGDALAANAAAAEAAAEAATNAVPDGFAPSWAPLRVRAFFALQTGDDAAAAEAAEALLEARGGHDFFGHYVLALAADKAGDRAKADARFQASLAERAVWFVLNDYAASLDARGATAPALVFARQAIAAGGEGQAAVQDTLGMALLHAGDAGGALEALRRAAALPGGGMPAIRLDLAEALAANGLRDELAEQLDALEPALAVADESIRKRAAKLREELK